MMSWTLIQEDIEKTPEFVYRAYFFPLDKILFTAKTVPYLPKTFKIGKLTSVKHQSRQA